MNRFQNFRGFNKSSQKLGITLNTAPLQRVIIPYNLLPKRQAQIFSHPNFRRSMISVVNELNTNCGSCPSH